jgi:hypothetical protein
VILSTANPRAWRNDGLVTDIRMLPNDRREADRAIAGGLGPRAEIV